MASSALARSSRKLPTNYDPKKGLQRIAVAETAEKHYARAKDVEGLRKAIREKLERQAEFVLWWDTQANKSKGGRPRKKGQ